jgi:hypothetical protein
VYQGRLNFLLNYRSLGRSTQSTYGFDSLPRQVAFARRHNTFRKWLIIRTTTTTSYSAKKNQIKRELLITNNLLNLSCQRPSSPTLTGHPRFRFGVRDQSELSPICALLTCLSHSLSLFLSLSLSHSLSLSLSLSLSFPLSFYFFLSLSLSPSLSLSLSLSL